MAAFDYTESLITVRRKGDSNDPYISLVRNIMVKSGKVQLPEIPNSFEKVTVTGNSQTWIEISDGTPTGTNYKVSYLHGYIEFDPINDGKTLTFSFFGTGNTFLASERVWTISDGTTVTQTLKDKLSAMDTKNTSLQTQITDNELDIENKIAAHKTSSDHPAQNITYSGTVPSQTHVKGAIDATYSRIDNIIAGAPSSAAEVIDGRTLSDNVARASLGVAIREIHAKQLAAINNPVTIKHGLNSVNAPEGGKLDVKIKGKTLVNLLGKDGGCESLTGVTMGGTVALSNTQKRSGNTSYKVDPTSSNNYLYKDYSNVLDTTKQYILAGWIFIESYTTGGVNIRLWDVGGFVNQRYSTGVNLGTIGSWQFVYVKIPTANTFVGAGFRIQIGCSTTSTLVAYFDEIRLYELSSTDYTAIGTTYTATTTPSIDDFIPYVDSMKPLTTPYIEKKGKNLLPPFTQWTLHANVVATEPYKLTLNATASLQSSSINVDVISGQLYTLSVPSLTTNGQISVQFVDNNGGITESTPLYGSTLSATYTIPSNCKSLKLLALSWASGTFTFTNPQLELGSTASAFTEFNADHAYAISDSTGRPLALCSNIDGTVADEINLSTGIKFKRFEYLDLDGSLAWTSQADNAGFKTFRWENSNLFANDADGNIVKFNGDVLRKTTESASAFSASNSFRLFSTGLYISTSDTDSGFTEAMTPSADEIKAYFHGFKLCSSDGSAYVSGTKYWKKITDGTGITSTLPTASYTGYAPYKLQYQLATAAEEPVTVEGLINLHSGLNQVESGEGVIVREKATPYNYSEYSVYTINNISDVSNKLKYATNKIIAVYKNGVKDNKWVIFSNNVGGYGGGYAEITNADYDATADYTVSYILHDKYAITSNVVDITASVPSTQKAVTEQLLQSQADTQTSVSVNTKSIIDILARLKAAQI